MQCEIVYVSAAGPQPGTSMAVPYCSIHDMPMLKDSFRCPIARIEDAAAEAATKINDAYEDANARLTRLVFPSRA